MLKFINIVVKNTSYYYITINNNLYFPVTLINGYIGVIVQILNTPLLSALRMDRTKPW
jgi:hypothetical protein